MTSDWRATAQSSPATFGQVVSGGEYIRATHIDHLNRVLLRVAAGKTRRVVITMPPQHGKSSLTSGYFPAWYLGLFPDHNVILASYNGEYASEWGGKVREIMEEWGGPVFGTEVSQRSHAASKWSLRGRRAGGGMKTVGKGGSVTGRKANLFIIDDPFAGPEDAESAEAREKLWKWYLTVARTRLRPDGAIVVIQTRWHEDDIAGRILGRIERGETEEEWEVVDFPAIAEGLADGETDVLGRANGEALWPEVYGVEWLRITRQELLSAGMGSYYWSALYQQRPIPLEGGVFRRSWARYWWRGTIAGQEYAILARPDGRPRRVPLSACTMFQTVDLAASDKAGSAWTVVATWILTPDNDLLLIDVARLHAEGPEQFQLIRSAYAKWKPAYIGIESVGYQLTMVQNMRAEGLPITELSPEGKSKVSRALIGAAKMEGGGLYFPARPVPEWMTEYERELYNFPKYPFADQVDVTAYAAREAVRIGQMMGAIPIGFGQTSYWKEQ